MVLVNPSFIVSDVVVPTLDESVSVVLIVLFNTSVLASVEFDSTVSLFVTEVLVELSPVLETDDSSDEFEF